MKMGRPVEVGIIVLYMMFVPLILINVVNQVLLFLLGLLGIFSLGSVVGWLINIGLILFAAWTASLIWYKWTGEKRTGLFIALTIISTIVVGAFALLFAFTAIG